MKGNKALVMTPFEEVEPVEAKNWEYAVDLPEVDLSEVKMADVKKSQFTPSLFEFSGACAGCARPLTSRSSPSSSATE